MFAGLPSSPRTPVTITGLSRSFANWASARTACFSRSRECVCVSSTSADWREAKRMSVSCGSILEFDFSMTLFFLKDLPDRGSAGDLRYALANLYRGEALFLTQDSE